MAAFIVPDDESGRIVTFDVIESELHETIADVTSHAVEVGVDITDHVRMQPDQLSLIAYTSNTPIIVNPNTERGELRALKVPIPSWTPPLEPTPGSLFRSANSLVNGAIFGAPEAIMTVLAFPEEFDAIVETHEILLELQKNGVLLQIITSLRSYEDMVLIRVSAPRNAGDAGVAFGLDVRSLRIVESGQVASPPTTDVPGGKPLENKGGQGTKPPKSAEGAAAGSILYELKNKIKKEGIGFLF